MIRKKLLVKNLKDLKICNKNIKYHNKYIFRIELCGICLESCPKYFRFLDYTGEIGIYNKIDLEIPNKRCLIFCNLYIKKNEILLCCTESTVIEFYESLFYTLESINLSKHDKK